MADLFFIKNAAGALVPADQHGVDYLVRQKIGALIRGSFTKKNNPAFHRKLMTLFTFAFDMWEPQKKTYKGHAITKNFDRFRKDITILAGFYEVAYDINGNAKFVAKSLSFDSMDNDEREAVYSALIDVILKKILTSYRRADLDNVINQLMMGFA